MENKQVADMLLAIWPNIEKTVKFWERLPKSKRPVSKNYLNVADAVNDHFVTAKLAFFSYLPGVVEPIFILEKYQNDKPMLPFMY